MGRLMHSRTRDLGGSRPACGGGAWRAGLVSLDMRACLPTAARSTLTVADGTFRSLRDRHGATWTGSAFRGCAARVLVALLPRVPRGPGESARPTPRSVVPRRGDHHRRSERHQVPRADLLLADGNRQRSLPPLPADRRNGGRRSATLTATIPAPASSFGHESEAAALAGDDTARDKGKRIPAARRASETSALTN